MKHYQIEKAEVDFLISMAVAHHSTMDGIADRSYSLTVKLKPNADIQNILKPMFIKSNFALYGCASGQGERRSSMILCGDVSGTRRFQGDFKGKEMPHIHGVWILSPEDHADCLSRKLDPCALLKIELLKLREVLPERSAIEVKKIYDGFLGLRRFVSYSTKAPRQADRQGGIFSHALVLPYEIESSKACEGQRSMLHQSRLSVFEELQIADR